MIDLDIQHRRIIIFSVDAGHSYSAFVDYCTQFHLLLLIGEDQECIKHFINKHLKNQATFYDNLP